MAKKNITFDWIIENYSTYFKKFGVTAESLTKFYKGWKEERPKGSDSDFLWYVFQQFVSAIGKQLKDEKSIYQMNIELYNKMWEYLVIHENKNGGHIHRLWLENQLRLWQLEAEFKTNVVIISNSCCPHCESLHNTVMTFEHALKTQPLASNKCTRDKGCICSYGLESVRDKNGRLIRLTSS